MRTAECGIKNLKSEIMITTKTQEEKVFRYIRQGWDNPVIFSKFILLAFLIVLFRGYLANAQQLVQTFRGHESYITSLAFSPDGKFLASGSRDGTVKIWDLKAGHIGQEFNAREWVYQIAFSPEGRLLAASGQTERVRLWDLKRKKLVQLFRGYGPIAFSPDGKLLAAGGENRIKIFDLDRGKRVKTLSGTYRPIYTLAFSPDGNLLASGGGDKFLRIWDARRGRLLKTLSGHKGDIRDLVFSPDGKVIYTADDQKSIRFWDIKEGEQIGEIRTSPPLAISPGGKLLVTGSDRSEILFWDLVSMTRVRTIPDQWGVFDLAISPNGRYLASGNMDNEVLLWDVDGVLALLEVVITSQYFKCEYSYSENRSQEVDYRLVLGMMKTTVKEYFTESYFNHFFEGFVKNGGLSPHSVRVVVKKKGERRWVNAQDDIEKCSQIIRDIPPGESVFFRILFEGATDRVYDLTKIKLVNRQAIGIEKFLKDSYHRETHGQYEDREQWRVVVDTVE